MIWLNIAILDMIVFYVFYTRIICLFKDIVLCDRYVEDTLIDFKRNFPGIFNNNNFLWKLLTLLTPKSYQSFLLIVPIEISLKRSKIKKEPYPDTPETLSFRLNEYLNDSIFPPDRYYKINTQIPIEEVTTKIVKKLKRFF